MFFDQPDLSDKTVQQSRSVSSPVRQSGSLSANTTSLDFLLTLRHGSGLDHHETKRYTQRNEHALNYLEKYGPDHLKPTNIAAEDHIADISKKVHKALIKAAGPCDIDSLFRADAGGKGIITFRDFEKTCNFVQAGISRADVHEIALELERLGVKTTLISGPTNINYSKDIKVKKVTSGKQMFDIVKRTLPADIAVCSAAVSDFKPLIKNKNKIKKKQKFNEIKLEKNPDILEFLGKNNRYKPKLLVGFSAETDNVINNSIDKMKEKYCDMIIANDVSKKTSGFNVDFNEVTIIDKKGNTHKIKRNSKKFVASIIARKIMNSFLDIKKNLN